MTTDNDVYPQRREPPACPYCDRIMTWREKDEQGACNDCYGGLVQDMGNRL